MDKIDFVKEAQELIGEGKNLTSGQKERLRRLQEEHRAGGIEIGDVKQRFLDEVRGHRVYGGDARDFLNRLK